MGRKKGRVVRMACKKGGYRKRGRNVRCFSRRVESSPTSLEERIIVRVHTRPAHGKKRSRTSPNKGLSSASQKEKNHPKDLEEGRKKPSEKKEKENGNCVAS